MLEYTQQLLLSALLDVCARLNKEAGPDGTRELVPVFNVELLVQCVRLSPNPQTHHHALLLLSTAAAIFPVSACVHASVSGCSMPEHFCFKRIENISMVLFCSGA